MQTVNTLQWTVKPGCWMECFETSSWAIAETVLHGGLVMAKSGRLELGDNIVRTL